MKAKKYISIIFTGIVAAGILTGCGSSNSKSQTNRTKTTETSKTTEAAKDIETSKDTEASAGTEAQTSAVTEAVSEVSAANATETDTESAGKTLVVYYSATGTTAGVAQTIADATGGDLFEIVPTEPYTDDDLNWRNSNSRVSKEHDDESLREVELVSTSVDDWDSYDTVFIGYPIWWGIAAWPVDGFVKANDFTGKTVIPFATSSSSGMGQSGSLLADMAGTGDWQDGQRFSSGASAEEVSSWVESLNLK